MTISTLSHEEIEDIHVHLEENFRNSKDPISPPGIKSIEMLESAAARQHVGFGNGLKYPSKTLNAASLCYGVVSNHPFYNGNKRAALVSLLCHLDKNGLILTSSVRQDDLYKFMVRVASHYYVPKNHKGDGSDIEVAEMGKWIHRRTRKIKNSERVITYRELFSIIRSYGFSITNRKNNYTDIVGELQSEVRSGFLGRRKVVRAPMRYKVTYPSDGRVVPKSTVRKVREACNLTQEFGIDAEVFYGREQPLDNFITRYRQTLTRLAKT